MNYFITYGDNKFKKSKGRLLNQAIDFGFDFSKAYSFQDLSGEFIKHTSPFINFQRGGGYWIWKAFILKDIFSQMSEGDVVVYLDAGCKINIEGKARFYEYLKILDQNKGFLAFHLNDCFEYMYTNCITFDFFNVKRESIIYNSNMMVGGILMFKKNELTIRFIEEFYSLATKNPNIFTDQNSFSLDYRFIEHRHDQSILSILRKKYLINSIPDETCSVDWNELKNTPFHAMRIKDVSFYKKVLNKIKVLFKNFVINIVNQ